MRIPQPCQILARHQPTPPGPRARAPGPRAPPGGPGQEGPGQGSGFQKTKIIAPRPTRIQFLSDSWGPSPGLPRAPRRGARTKVIGNGRGDPRALPPPRASAVTLLFCSPQRNQLSSRGAAAETTETPAHGRGCRGDIACRRGRNPEEPLRTRQRLRTCHLTCCYDDWVSSSREGCGASASESPW